MSYEKFRLTDDAISTNGVEAAPDKLTGTTQENKKVFDRLIRAVVKDIINGLAEQIGADVARFDSGEGKISAETAAALELDEGATLNDALVRLKNMAASGGIPTAEFVAVSKATAEAYGLEGDVNVDMVLQVITEAINEATSKSYSKEESLSSSTKTALGLGEDAVPDDAFASLGWHNWATRALEAYMSASGIRATTKYQSSDATDTFYYGDEITINSAGRISIVNPNSVTYQYDASGSVVCAELSNKYFATSADNLAVVYKGGDTVYKNNTASGGYITYMSYVDEYSVRYGTKHYVSSANHNAYPDNGIVDNVEYEYLGSPLENAKEAYGMRLHWWKRGTKESGYTIAVSNTAIIWEILGAPTMHYSSKVQVDASGVLSLVNPQSILVSSANFNSTVADCFVSNSNDTTNAIYKIKGIPNVSKVNSFYTITSCYLCYSEFVENNGEYEYVSSPDRNAYPDSGTEGIFSYQYLAVPFENAREGAKIVTGSYVGTGTYGASNPNSLTFDFEPKILIMLGKYTEGKSMSSSREQYFGHTGSSGMTQAAQWAIVPSLLTTSMASGKGFCLYAGNRPGDSYAKKSDDGKTIYWYHTQDATSQGNAAADGSNYSKMEYYYLAIG